jgi:hypothetical protein
VEVKRIRAKLQNPENNHLRRQEDTRDEIFLGALRTPIPSDFPEKS